MTTIWEMLRGLSVPGLPNFDCVPSSHPQQSSYGNCTKHICRQNWVDFSLQPLPLVGGFYFRPDFTGLDGLGTSPSQIN